MGVLNIADFFQLQPIERLLEIWNRWSTMEDHEGYHSICEIMLGFKGNNVFF
jgi:hypothetical protein